MTTQRKSFLFGSLRLLMCILIVAQVSVVVAAEESIMDYATDEAMLTQLRVELTNDLAVVSALSQEKGVPILLMFSTEDCTYCERLEAEVLGPMRKAGIDPQRVILRKIIMDEYDNLRDFTGRERNAESFAMSRGVEVVPTLELLDATGKLLVPKIEGYQTPGLYGAYLDKAIEVSKLLLEKHS